MALATRLKTNLLAVLGSHVRSNRPSDFPNYADAREVGLADHIFHRHTLVIIPDGAAYRGILRNIEFRLINP